MVKKSVAFLFLYVTFIILISRFTIGIWDSSKPIGFFLDLTFYFLWVIVYALINHIIVRKIVGLKTVVIFETLLFVTILAIAWANVAWENGCRINSII